MFESIVAGKLTLAAGPAGEPNEQNPDQTCPEWVRNGVRQGGFFGYAGISLVCTKNVSHLQDLNSGLDLETPPLLWQLYF